MSHEQDKSNETADATAWTQASPEAPAADTGSLRSAEERAAALQSELERVKGELAESQRQMLYDRAELENFRRRMQREKAESLRYAIEPLSRDLLPVVDNLERAIEHGGDGQPMLEGLQMVLKMLLDVLNRHGIQRIEAVGAKFDPAKHEAIAHVESEEQEANHVTQQHQVGYQLHDRLLRPAMVSVGRGKTTTPVESPQNSD